MAWGHSYSQHHSYHRGAGIRFQLDCSFWCTIYDYHRLRGTVRVWPLAAADEILGTHRIRTTAYHPVANRLVERFHRQLKAALSTAPRTQWIEALPLVLLGIHSSLKEDLHTSTSELVYGTTLRLPGQFFAPSLDKEVTGPASYVSRLRTHMQQVHPTPTSHRARIKPCQLFLNTCTHVFVRCDALRKALQPTYDGPFKVIRRASNFFLPFWSMDKNRPSRWTNSRPPTSTLLRM